MSRLRIKLLAATTMIAAFSFAGGAVAQASLIATDSSTGATYMAALVGAKAALRGDFYGCGTITLLSDGQNPDGTWTAFVQAQCEGIG
jgi:hypothetical protein